MMMMGCIKKPNPPFRPSISFADRISPADLQGPHWRAKIEVV